MVAVAMVLHVKDEAFTAIWVYTQRAQPVPDETASAGGGGGANAKNINIRTLGRKINHSNRNFQTH